MKKSSQNRKAIGQTIEKLFSALSTLLRLFPRLTERLNFGRLHIPLKTICHRIIGAWPSGRSGRYHTLYKTANTDHLGKLEYCQGRMFMELDNFSILKLRRITPPPKRDRIEIRRIRQFYSNHLRRFEMERILIVG